MNYVVLLFGRASQLLFVDGASSKKSTGGAMGSDGIVLEGQECGYRGRS